MIRSQHRLKLKAKKESWGYKMLMALPRNLVKVFVLVILLAFLSMIYVVYTGSDLKNFLKHDLVINENLMEHPLFYHFQTTIPQPTEIEKVELKNLDSVTFYQNYLTQNKPVLVKDGSETWKAKERWNLDYLNEQYGMQSILIHMLDKGKSNPGIGFDYTMESSKRNNFDTFLQKRSNVTEKYHKLYYVHQEMIVSMALKNDYDRPDFITKILRNRLTGLTVWSQFRRAPEYKERERYYCVVSGIEEFRLVSPVYKQNIYSGILEELNPVETPLDFFARWNYTKFPLAKSVKMITAKVEAGQCIYIPAYYWQQSQTQTEKTIMVSFEYEAHSELTSLFFKAIDQGILED
eukprot:403337013